MARLLAKEGTRLKKKERPHFVNGQTILSFLDVKAWSTPLFEELVAKQRRGARGSSNSSNGSSSHQRKSLGPYEGALRDAAVETASSGYLCGGNLTGLEAELGLLPLASPFSASPLGDSRAVQGLDLSGRGRRRAGSGAAGERGLARASGNEAAWEASGAEAAWEAGWVLPLLEPRGPGPPPLE